MNNFILEECELPKFDKTYGWYSVTRIGLVTQLFEHFNDQMNDNLFDEARKVVERIINTRKPPHGSFY